MTFATSREQPGFATPATRSVSSSTAPSSTTPRSRRCSGWAATLLLTDRAKRRKYGLPPELRPPKLEDDRGRASHYLRHDSDWVNADITVSTDADQVADRARLSSVGNARPTAGASRAIGPTRRSCISSRSSRRATRSGSDRWHDVDLAVYYHPAHAYNVERMVTAMKESLDYFGANFSPFQFKQLGSSSSPATHVRAVVRQHDPLLGGDRLHREQRRSDEKIDLVTYVTAHEVGHQWWAHQVMARDMQGMTMLVETLAQYSALMVMESMYGPEQIRKFLKFELDTYLRRRGGEADRGAAAASASRTSSTSTTRKARW